MPQVVKNLLLTGGAGFIGANLTRYYLAHCPAVRVIVYDALTYAGSLANLQGLAEEYPTRYRFVHGDITDAAKLTALFAAEKIDTVAHLAAESHVDRSIDAPDTFMRTNIGGTFTLLQVARAAWADGAACRFHHVSTDEVFGALPAGGFFHESTPYDPSSPYSASKAASDHLVRAWGRTYHLPVTLSNCSNNYGEYQFPEKLLPLMIEKALAGEKLPVYGTGENVRDWLYVGDHCAALAAVIAQGENGRSYNIGGGNEWRNLDLIYVLCDLLAELRPGRNYRELVTLVADRPGHDFRYAIDASRIRDELGWRPQYDFPTGLRKTVAWYLANEKWRTAVRHEKYQGERLGKS
jgi:dTDP-glucose 4,6-dehydratase